ncbi:MAG: hypothetical protein IJV96_07760 [Clostridia bacterium]|nr:hypothetical protein [Clostridia bacterium]
MGFGYLFLGFLLTFNIPYAEYSDFFATALMLWGLSTLSPYAKGFQTAFRTGIVLAGIHFVRLFFGIFELLSLFTLPAPVVSGVAAASLLVRAVFIWFIFAGIDEVAKETDLPKLREHALRSRFLTPVFCAAGLVLEVGVFTHMTAFLGYYLLGYIIFGILYAFFNAKTVYECYILICFEGEENMDRKPSRFGFVNRFRKWSDEQDEKTVRRRAEDRARKEQKKKERGRNDKR